MQTPFLNLSVFDIRSEWLADEIYLWNVKEEVNKAVNQLGGPAKASKIMKVKKSRLKEWHLGRNPIPLSKLNELLLLVDKNLKQQLTKEINSKQVYLKCQYSNHTVKFPNKLIPELAYLIGLLLGDGYLAGNSLNKTGNWGISVFFDNIDHLKIYKKHVEEIFDIKTKIYKPPKNCHTAYFASKSLHWFFRSFFSLHNGYKADKIEIPEKITETKNSEIINACIRGLFDSDGTVLMKTKTVSFSSTSKKVVNQVIFWLKKLGINAKKHKWLKDKKYKMLFTVRLYGKSNLLKFSEEIGFSHPEKKKRLYKISQHLCI